MWDLSTHLYWIVVGVHLNGNVLCCVTQSFLTPCNPHGLWANRLLCPWRFSGQDYQSGLPYPPPGDLPNPGIEPRSPALQVDSLPTEPPVKPKNTGAGSLSLFQGIFLTQELNQGLLHCRQILYQLSYQERHINRNVSLQIDRVLQL